VAFLRQEGGAQHLAVVDREGRRERVLLRSAGPETLAEPQWAPRGNWLLLARIGRRGGLPAAQLWLVDAAGNAARRKVDDVGRPPGMGAKAGPLATWAPDARHFAYLQWPEGGEFALRIGRTDGRTWRLDTLGGVDDPQVAWAPDGRRLLYLKGAGERRLRRLVLATPDGSPRTLATSGGVTDAAWSPSGDRICYAEPQSLRMGGNGHTGAALIVRTDAGRPVHRIAGAPAGAQMRRPAWSPDGRRIAYEVVSAGGRRQAAVASAGDGRVVVAPAGETDERLIGWVVAGTALLVDREMPQPDGGIQRSAWLRFVV
jgi:Tol biopolymer transport system component